MKNLIYFSVVCFSIGFIIIKISTAFDKILTALPPAEIVIKDPDPQLVKQLIEIRKMMGNVENTAIIALPFALSLLIIGRILNRCNNQE